MKIAILSLCAILGLTNAASLSASGGRIVGGFQIDIAEIPYQVSLHRNGRHHCGGSIISSRWVLTAAHCTEGNLNPEVYAVRVGSSDRDDGGVLAKIRTVIPHPDYDSDTTNNDFSLLELEESLAFGRSVQHVELAEGGAELENGAMCTVSGWGNTKNNHENSRYLRAVNVPSVGHEECSKLLEDVAPVTDRMMCAGYAAGGKDSCQGDSGGPLVSDGKLVGVVSWGKGCALPNLPGVYAKVSSVRDWIREVTEV